MRPRRCAMNSSASTEVFASTSTRSIAMIGISASITRRRELANASSTLLRVKSTWPDAAWNIQDLCRWWLRSSNSPLGRLPEGQPPPVHLWHHSPSLNMNSRNEGRLEEGRDKRLQKLLCCALVPDVHASRNRHFSNLAHFELASFYFLLCSSEQ